MHLLFKESVTNEKQIKEKFEAERTRLYAEKTELESKQATLERRLKEKDGALKQLQTRSDALDAELKGEEQLSQQPRASYTASSHTSVCTCACVGEQGVHMCSHAHTSTYTRMPYTTHTHTHTHRHTPHGTCILTHTHTLIHIKLVECLYMRYHVHSHFVLQLNARN